MNRKVSVIVLTWNALEYTQQCLTSLFARTTYPTFEVVVVDNGSTDGTVEWLRGQERLAVIENGRNLGFTAGVNIGLGHTDPASDVVLLNNDIVITQGDWIERLQDTAYAADDIGLVGCRLVEPDGRLNHAGSYMPAVSLQGEQLAGRELDIGQYTARRQVQCTIAAVMYVKRELVDRIGGLHKEYFSYFEDTDYCLEAARAGYRTMYAGDVNLLHHHNTSTRLNAVDFWHMYLESKEIFVRRWKEYLEGQHTVPIDWHSVLTAPRGAARASKAIMSALELAGAAVSYENVSQETGVEPSTGDPVVEDVRRRPKPACAARVAYTQADLFPRMAGTGPRFGFTKLGMAGLPAPWVDACNGVDEVWVPSQFDVETFRDSGVNTPIEVVPLGVDTEYFHPGVKRFRTGSDFLFLSVFEWGGRNDAELLVRSFGDTFSRADDAVLLLVVGRHDSSVDVAAEIASFGLHPDGGRIVVAVDPEIPDSQMPALYKAADAFVLPSRGEGWGMPILEAMAVGVPTIATNWSAPAEFLDDTCGYPIEVVGTVPSPAQGAPYEGAEWAEPSEEHLRHLLRHVYEDREDAALKAAAGAERAGQFTWARTAERILELVQRRL